MERLDTTLQIKSFSPDSGVFSGYGSVFGVVDSHRDVVAPGAFRDTLAEAKASGAWPAMLLMHGMGKTVDDQLPIGVWTKMEEDSKGLYVEGKLALGNRRAEDVYALMRMTPRPALNGLSIGYRAKRFKIHASHENVRRTLQAVDLAEVSLVVDPSNARARISSVKSISGYDEAAARFSETLCRLAVAA